MLTLKEFNSKPPKFQFMDDCQKRAIFIKIFSDNSSFYCACGLLLSHVLV